MRALVTAIAAGATADAMHASRAAVWPASPAGNRGRQDPNFSLLAEVGSGLVTVVAAAVTLPTS
jgi:hypothetical protein